MMKLWDTCKGEFREQCVTHTVSTREICVTKPWTTNGIQVYNINNV